MSCPDDDELSRYLDRTLSAPRVRALEDHFDSCRVCRQLAYLLAELLGVHERLPSASNV